MSDLTEFLRARIAEDEAQANEVVAMARDAAAERPDRTLYAHHDGAIWRPSVSVGAARVLAECEAKRRIIEWHKSWPVLVETQPQFETTDAASPSLMSFKMTQRIAWLTQQEYRARFGDEPPTAPILLMLALPYRDHPDYDEGWRP